MILYLSENCLQKKAKIKKFSDKRKLAEFFARRAALYDVIKEVLLDEGRGHQTETHIHRVE